VADWYDIATFRARTGEPVATPDVLLRAALSSVQASVVSFLGYDPTPGTFTEFLDGDGTPAVFLSRRYVNAVTEVRLDTFGQYGQGDPAFPPFGPTTILLPGTYFLQIRGSDRTGILYRGRGLSWPNTWTRHDGRLSSSPTTRPGCIRVTYSTAPDAGCPSIPPDIMDAVYFEAAARTTAWATGMGSQMSSSLDGRSVSVSAAPGVIGGIPSPFLSPIALALLTRHRRVAAY